MLAIQKAGLEAFEYTPKEIKNAVAGYGGADKRQVQEMVRALLQLDSIPKPDDAADALVLVTEWHEYRNPDFDRLKTLLKGLVLIDGRNQWPLADVRSRGFKIAAIGRP
jgi:Holliday junction resolvasome RuvABC endonuclease subunit